MNPGMAKEAIWVFVLALIPPIEGQCTFPESFNGTWVTSFDGTWVTNSTHLLNYKAVSPSGVFLNSPNPTLDFICFIQDGTKYVLRSAEQVELFTGFFIFMHTCIDLREITSSKYVYYYGTAAESTGLRFTSLDTVAEVCTQTNHDLAYNQHLALLNGSETSGLTLCPPSIYGSYFYNTCNDSNSNTTSVDVCDSRQQLIFNYTLCNTTQMFTSEGTLDCLFYDDVDTVSYVTLYNRDSTTPDGSNTYQFVCLAIELSGSTVFITANPETCTENQSPTNISSPGQIIQFTPFFLCPFTGETDSPFDFLPIILGVAGFVALLLLIIIVVCCCKRCKRHKRKRRKRKKKKKRKKKDEEAPSSDDESDDDDASSRSSDSRCSSRSSSEQQRFEHEEEKKSVDSGISEPAVTHRTDREREEEGGRSEKELVINDDGEKEVDDKGSRPHSGQRSRMSDLPPSTLPDEEKPGTSASDPDEQTVRDGVQEQRTEDAGDDAVENELSREGQLKEEADEEQIEEKVENGESLEKDGDDGEDRTITPTEKEKKDEESVPDEEGETEDEEEYDSEDSENEIASKTGVNVVNQTISQSPSSEQEQLETKEDTGKVKDEHSGEIEVRKEDESNPTVTQDHQEGVTDKNGEDKDRGVDDKDNVETEEDSEEEEEKEEEEQEEEEEDEGEDEGEEEGTGDEGNRNIININSTNVTEEGEHIQENSRVEVENEWVENKADNDEEINLGETAEKGQDPDSYSVKSTLKNEIGGNENDLTSKFEENAKEYENERIDKEKQQDEQGNVSYDDKDRKLNTEATVGNLPKNDGVDKELFIIPPPVQVEDEQKKEQREGAEMKEGGEEEETGRKEKKEEGEEESDQDSLTEKKKKLRRKQQRKQSTEDEITQEYNKIGQKKNKEHRSVRSLTTVLVSRRDEEKKRTKNKSKSESQNMKNLARKRTKKLGTKGDKESDFVIEDEDIMYSSDDDTRQPGERSAPFIKQYNNKKRIEHILDQQHYWSDPEAEMESFGINESMTSIFGDGSTIESGSDYEDLIGPDGTVHRVKRLKDVIDRELCSSDPLGTKRPKSFESLTSVEDPESPGGHVSKKRLNEHYIGRERGTETINNETVNGKTENKDVNGIKSKTRLVLVKENTLDNKSSRNKKECNDVDNDKEDSDLPSGFCDTDIDKLSERDSGLDDDVEDAVDVVLNKEQQAMIVAMLFDEEMNLRPQFARDENGRIIRRLDNTVIYDPHTGRFTFHKRLGRIFNIPRLRRNAKGRPTGGYIDDPFGPHESEMPRTPSSKLRLRTASGRSIRSHVTTEVGSPSPEMKRSRGEGKFVGFKMPEDDAQSLTSDQLAAHKRGRRDIGSAIRRKLNKRLFRKKMKKPEVSTLPDVVSKRAWTQEGIMNGHDTTLGPKSQSSLSVPYSRTGTAYGTQGTARKVPSNANSEQQEMFRQGLERDKRILEERQDILNKRPVEAFKTVDDEADASENLEGETENGYFDPCRPAFHTSQSFYTDDGRLVVRERGCPELQRPATLFTIVRQQEDLEREATDDAHDKGDNRDRFCKSAPSQVKPPSEQTFQKENTFLTVRRDGSESQLSGIDNNRLRKLLEELYKDKKYFDEYIESKEPESEEFIHSKGLAEHGRGYLLERAEYWERRGPLPPKPPMTEIGWKMHRQQTMLESRLNSDRSSTVLTLTPNSDQKPSEQNTLPGVVENQNGDLYEVQSNESRA